MTTVMVMMAITTVTIMTPLVLLSEGAREEYHHDPFSSDIHIHTQNMLHTSNSRHTHGDGDGPTYAAVNVREAGWMDGEVWVEVKVVDGWRKGGVWASGRRRAASGPGASHTEAACRPPTERKTSSETSALAHI